MQNLPAKRTARQIALDLVQYMAGPSPLVGTIREKQEALLDACCVEARSSPECDAPGCSRNVAGHVREQCFYGGCVHCKGREQLVAGARVVPRIEHMQWLSDAGRDVEAGDVAELLAAARKARELAAAGMDACDHGENVGKLFPFFRAIAALFVGLVLVIGCGGSAPTSSDAGAVTCESYCRELGALCLDECECAELGGVYRVKGAPGAFVGCEISAKGGAK